MVKTKHMFGWSAMSDAVYEPIRVKTMLNAVRAPSMPFSWSMNPYKGCRHGCSFCYARYFHTYMGEKANDRFQNHIYVKENAAEALEAQLRRLASRPRGLAGVGPVAIGTATDPYQPREAKERITRRCLEVLAEYGISASITTRSPLVLRDADILRKLPSVTVNISVNTLNPAVWRAFEPHSPRPDKRLEAVRRLNDAGIRAGVFLAPILPLITDGKSCLNAVVERAAEAGAAFVAPSVLRLATPEVKAWFFRALRRYNARLVDRYADLYDRSAHPPASYRAAVLGAVEAALRRVGLPAGAAVDEAEPQDTASPATAASDESPADSGAQPVQLCLPI